jgi:hypothetical protein
MFEFLTYRVDSRKSYFRAVDFIDSKTLPYKFKHWTRKVQDHMEGHLLHVGGDRTRGVVSWTSRDDEKYLDDFGEAWRTLMTNLKPEHREVFRDEIEHRVDSEFRHCGSLGREFIV